jgi:hypothetical protein
VSRLKHSTEVAISTAAVEMVREKNDRITTLERELAEARKEAAGLRECVKYAVKWGRFSDGTRTRIQRTISTPATKHFVSVDEVKAFCDEWESKKEPTTDPYPYGPCVIALRELVEESK